MRAKAEVNVLARNNLGRFIDQIEMAGTQTVKDMVDEGAKQSKRLAPVGHRSDHRSIPIRESIFSAMRGPTQGSWGASARHAMFVEKGTRPHPIVGSPFLFFWWEAARRWWVPGLFGEIDIVNHPGAEAQPFLEPALAMVMARWRRIAAKHYPRRR
jgi:hypothetical protein